MTRPALDCPAARELIDAYLVDGLDDGDAARLADHVRTCAACSARIGSATRLMSLLAELGRPAVPENLDERIILAAIADRRRRMEHRSWLEDLRAQVLRGAMRTTGTLVVTIVSVALLGGAFVFAAAGFIAQTAQNPTPRGTLPSEVTPTPAPTHEQAAMPRATPRANPTPAAIAVSPTATAHPGGTATLAPTRSPGPTPEPSAPSAATPTLSPSPSPTESPTPSPSPTDKRRTPPPSAGTTSTPSPTASTTSP